MIHRPNRRDFLKLTAAASGGLGLGLSPDPARGAVRKSTPSGGRAGSLLILGGTGFIGPYQVRSALALTWRKTGGEKWVSLQPAETLSGNATAEHLARAEEMTITLSHRSVRFPHSSWVGASSITVGLRE